MCEYEDDLLAVTKRVVWFEPPEQALGQGLRFLAYVMTYATLEELLVVQKYFSEADFRAALLDAPPGVFDPRSWNYWNLVYGFDPVPPLPKRVIPD